MRWSLFLPTLALAALTACGESSDALGPSTGAATSETLSQQSAGNAAVTDSAPQRGLEATRYAAMAHANLTLQLAGRTVARCESQLAPRVFVNDSAALEPALSPAVTRVLAGRVRLRLPALLQFGARCPAGK